MKIKSSSKKNLLLATAIVAVYSSCKKDVIETTKISPQREDKELYKALLEGGVNSESITDLSEYYLVGGDMLFKKNKTNIEKVNAFFGNGNLVDKSLSMKEFRSNGSASALKGGPDKISQWQTVNIVSPNNIEAIGYKSYFNSYPEWQNAIQNAINQWNSINDMKIGFYFNDDLSYNNSSSINGIVFIEDDGVLENNVIAAAEFPSADNAGYRIRINLDFNNNYPVTNSGRLYNMVHEIGHCIGFIHTNAQVPINQLINGTPQSDANSVMNGGTALYQWVGFSYYDLIAARTLYPYNTYDRWISDVNYFAIYNNQIPPNIEWNPNLVSTNTVTIELLQHGVSKGIIGQNVPNTGSYTFDYSSLLGSTLNKYGVQLRITSDSNPSITDMTKAFNFYQD